MHLKNILSFSAFFFILLGTSSDLTLMWSAHISSITSGLGVCESTLSHLSTSEKSFGVGWGKIVDFIAATGFVTNMNNTNHFQVSLAEL